MTDAEMKTLTNMVATEVIRRLDARELKAKQGKSRALERAAIDGQSPAQMARELLTRAPKKKR